MSKGGEHVLSLQSEVVPIPLDRIHSWVVAIETRDGAPVEDAIITIDGGMPEHRHGLPTRPEVTAHLGAGRYRVEGMKFSMTGHWVLEVRFWVGDRRDEATFDVDIRA